MATPLSKETHMIDQECKQALLGHNLVMSNLSIFHLLLPILAFSTDYTKEIMALSLLASLIFASLIFRGRKSTNCSEFVSAHWKMAWRRTRYLLISYIVSISVMGLGLLLTSTQTDPQMKKILLTTFIPMAIVPTLITVIVVLVLQTMTMSRAKQGLIPNNKI